MTFKLQTGSMTLVISATVFGHLLRVSNRGRCREKEWVKWQRQFTDILKTVFSLSVKETPTKLRRLALVWPFRLLLNFCHEPRVTWSPMEELLRTVCTATFCINWSHNDQEGNGEPGWSMEIPSVISSMAFMIWGGSQVGVPHFFPHPRLFLLLCLPVNLSQANLLAPFAFTKVRLFLTR